MKFSLNQETLLPATQLVAHVAQARSVHPVYSHLLLHLDGSLLTITGHDGVCLLRVGIQADKAEPGEAMVRAQDFLELCQQAPSDRSIDFSLAEDRVLIRGAGLKYQLPTLQTEEFPAYKMEKGLEIKVPTEVLHRLLKKTLCCAPAQDFRNYLMGVLLDLTPERLTAVATDTHKMAVARWNNKTDLSEQTKVIIPRRSCEELLRLLELARAGQAEQQGDEDEDDKGDKKSKKNPGLDFDTLSITVAEQAARFEVGNLFLYTALLQGTYPDYEPVLPPDEGSSALLANTESLRRALRRLSVVADHGGAVTWQIDKQQTQMLVQNQGAEGEETIPSEFSGEPMRVGFNVDYLLTILENIDSDKTQLLLIAEDERVDIREQDAQDTRYILMPLRL